MSHFILVHGAWEESRAWNDAAAPLRQSGHEVTAIDLPGHGANKQDVSEVTMAGYVQSVVNTLNRLDHPVILVGHSMTGSVISQVAERIPQKIERLIFVAAFLLKDGGTVMEAMQSDAGNQLLPQVVFSDDQTFGTVSEETFRSVGLHDVDERVIERVLPLMGGKQATEPFMAKMALSESNFGSVPKTYIRTDIDRVTSPELQDRMIANWPVETVLDIEAGHFPAFSVPEKLAELLAKSASAPKSRRASGSRTRLRSALTSILAAVLSTGAASAASPGDPIKLLTANFESRAVAQVEVGDFHFVPGQVAPIHTHAAPAVGYVAKGEIIYQVEGEKPQILREGDAFYEPAGPRILRFDNASATEEAIFLDFNLERAGEPFIVFEKTPTEAIDRRSLPTVDLGGKSVGRVDVYTRELPSGASVRLDRQESAVGLVAEGIVEVAVEDRPPLRIVSGESFSLPAGDSPATVTNSSDEVPAEVVMFRMR